MKLALGTVQFGVDYGITNTSGIVETSEVADILDTAYDSSIRILDTAAAYGSSEEVLGRTGVNGFNIVSKIPSLSTTEYGIAELITLSLKKLNKKSLYGMMFHNESDLKSESYYQLLIAKDKGLIGKVGCSFYTPTALEAALNKDMPIDLIQVPMSCLDQRFLTSGLIEEAKSRNIEVHIRSLFLQGLLLQEESVLPANIQNSKSELERFFSFCRSLSLSPLVVTMKFLQQTSSIDYGVVGCLSSTQLKEILAAYSIASEISENLDFSQVNSDNTMLLNPSTWR